MDMAGWFWQKQSLQVLASHRVGQQPAAVESIQEAALSEWKE